MKFPTIAIVLGAFLVAPAFGDASLKSDTLIKGNTVGACTNAGKQRGADEAKTKRFCECMWNVLADNLTREEFMQMDKLGAQGGNPGELPAFKRIQPQLMACQRSEGGAPKP